jgi:hypothetical protein
MSYVLIDDYVLYDGVGDIEYSKIYYIYFESVHMYVNYNYVVFNYDYHYHYIEMNDVRLSAALLLAPAGAAAWEEGARTVGSVCAMLHGVVFAELRHHSPRRCQGHAPGSPHDECEKYRVELDDKRSRGEAAGRLA